MKIQYIVPTIAAFGFLSHAFGADGVITELVTDPTRTSGASAITSNTTATGGATAESTLEGLTGFAAIQDFTFGGNQKTNRDYIFNFTDSTTPDFKINYTGDIELSASSVNYTNNSSYYSSALSTMRWAADSKSSTIGLTIQLGNYNSVDDEFTNFTTGQGVTAFGFTINGTRFQEMSDSGVTVIYYDAAGNTLSTQIFANTISGTIHGYTGYQSTGAPIASVSLSVTGNPEGANAPFFGIDDLGTTLAIPEPNAYALLFGMTGFYFAACTRRKRA